MANPDGSFVWYELMTPDPDAIAPFYADVIGWTITKGDPKQSGDAWRAFHRRTLEPASYC